MKHRKAKIGLNRGKARLWLEGAWLAEAGFPVGTAYRASIAPGRVTFEVTPDGNRHVSGKGEKPIIDVNTDDLLQVAPALSYIVLTIRKGRITGSPERASKAA